MSESEALHTAIMYILLVKAKDFHSLKFVSNEHRYLCKLETNMDNAIFIFLELLGFSSNVQTQITIEVTVNR